MKASKYILSFLVITNFIVACKKKEETEKVVPTVWSFQTTKPVIDIDIKDNYLFAAVQGGLQIYDLTNPTHPTLLFDTILPEQPYLIKAPEDSVLYLATQSGMYSYKFKNNHLYYCIKFLSSSYYEPYVKILHVSELFIVSRKKVYVMDITNKYTPTIDTSVVIYDFECCDAQSSNGNLLEIKLISKSGGCYSFYKAFYTGQGWKWAISHTPIYGYGGQTNAGWYVPSDMFREPFVYARGKNGIIFLKDNQAKFYPTRNCALNGYTSTRLNYVYIADSLGVQIFKIINPDELSDYHYVNMNGLINKIVPLHYFYSNENYLYVVTNTGCIYIMNEIND
ncbi:MAG TPA: hypothetical protein PLP65_03290 [Bacteroidales bacterium]|nr:hypothetical protein [Bacteroidales bacterium]